MSWLNLVQEETCNPNVCGPYAVRRTDFFFLSGTFLGNHMPYLDDIWYVGGARAKGAHAEPWAWYMLIKHLICIIYSKNCPEHFSGTDMPYLYDIWYVGRARAESAHAKFWAWQYWSPGTPGVKYVKQCHIWLPNLEIWWICKDYVMICLSNYITSEVLCHNPLLPGLPALPVLNHDQTNHTNGAPLVHSNSSMIQLWRNHFWISLANFWISWLIRKWSFT